MALTIPKVLSVVVLAATGCGPALVQKDAGVDAGPDAGVGDGGADAGMLCPPGCTVWMRDGGPVFFPDGGPYCLC